MRDDPAPVRLRPAAHRRRGDRDHRRERQRQDPGGRAEPAPDPPAAAGLPGRGGGPEPGGRPARRPRRGRPPGDRRDDHALRGHPLRTGPAALRAAGRGHRDGRRPQVRHRGTFGGALSHADPAGDLPAVALAFGTTMVVAGPAGRRAVPASELFADYLQTALEPAEVLVEVQVPKLGAGSGWGYRYEKFQRVAQAWAIVGVAALVRRSDGVIEQARVGLTNMGATPVRATAAGERVLGPRARVRGVEDPARRGADRAVHARGDRGAGRRRRGCRASPRQGRAGHGELRRHGQVRHQGRGRPPLRARGQRPGDPGTGTRPRRSRSA